MRQHYQKKSANLPGYIPDDHSWESWTACLGTCSMTTLRRSQTTCQGTYSINLFHETPLSATQVHRVHQTMCLTTISVYISFRILFTNTDIYDGIGLLVFNEVVVLDRRLYSISISIFISVSISFSTVFIIYIYDGIGLSTLKWVAVFQWGLLHIHLCIHLLLNSVHKYTHIYDSMGFLALK